MKDDAFERIDTLLSKWAADTDEPFSACVARHGVIVLNKAYGRRSGQPIDVDTPHFLASITKSMSGSLLMMFVDRGLVRLDDPVEKFLPEFAGQDVIQSATLHHLFTHTAGMSTHSGDGLADLEHIYGGQTYAQLEIGKELQYNGDSLGVGARVLEQLTGRTLPQLYKTCLFDPLGCERLEVSNASANALSTAIDLARLGQMLCNRGAYGDRRFFSEPTFEQMLPRRLTSVLGDDTDVERGIGLVWYQIDGFSDQVIGHGSATASTFRVDLKNQIVITMTRNARGGNFGTYHPQFLQTVADSMR